MRIAAAEAAAKNTPETSAAATADRIFKGGLRITTTKSAQYILHSYKIDIFNLLVFYLRILTFFATLKATKEPKVHTVYMCIQYNQ